MAQHPNILSGQAAANAVARHANLHLGLSDAELRTLRFNPRPTNVMAGVELLLGIGNHNKANVPAEWWQVSDLGWVHGTFAFKASRRLSDLLRLCTGEVPLTNLEAAMRTRAIDPRKRISEARAFGLPVASWTHGAGEDGQQGGDHHADQDVEQDDDYEDHPKAEAARQFIAACTLRPIGADAGACLIPLTEPLRALIGQDELRSELARVQNRFEHEIAATKARYIRLTGRKPQLQGSHD